jgi:hypothetical protein
MIVEAITFCVARGYSWRLRGDKTWFARLQNLVHRPQVALVHFLTLLWATGLPWLAAAQGVGRWAGTFIPHAKGQDLGRFIKATRGYHVTPPLDAALRDAGRLALVGLARGTLIAAAMALVGFPHEQALYLFGMAVTMPAAYALGWVTPFNLPILRARSIEWAEFWDDAFAGALILLAVHHAGLIVW